MNPSIEEQTASWNKWNAEFRENLPLHEHSEATSAFILSKIRITGKPLEILEIGCSTGWMSERLSSVGRVTATDLPGEVIDRAALRYPFIRFVPGDFMSLDFDRKFDLIVSMQTLPHIPDQDGFAAKVARLMRPGGQVIITCQNRFTFKRAEWVNQTPVPGQVRIWPSRTDMKRLFSPYLRVEKLTTIHPDGQLGILRLVNSHKLNKVAARIVSPGRLRGLKEHLGFGLFIGMVADAVQPLVDSGIANSIF
jgi:2-polyprenyl-3-methyl-5-hydroxy-6-metoxy-1,4-benzoquinol methylase